MRTEIQSVQWFNWINGVDLKSMYPDQPAALNQLASDEASLSGSTHFSKDFMEFGKHLICTMHILG